jgi:Domain of unknown function (DUF222)
MGAAGHLATRLPGTAAALADGTVSLGKARIIANATAVMDPDEARAAETGVLDRAGRLTPGSLRAAIARAVMEVAPDKARKRRETVARSPGWSGGPRIPATPPWRAASGPGRGPGGR